MTVVSNHQRAHRHFLSVREQCRQETRGELENRMTLTDDIGVMIQQALVLEQEQDRQKERDHV